MLYERLDTMNTACIDRLVVRVHLKSRVTLHVAICLKALYIWKFCQGNIAIAICLV